MSIEYITSQRGKQKLTFDNFTFVHDRTIDDTVYWKCEWFQKQCRSRLHVSKVENKIIKEVGVHNHRPDVAKITASKILTGIKRKAVECNETPNQIISSASVGVHLSVAAKLPNIKLMKKTIRRARNLEQDHPKNTLHPEDLVIPEKYKKTNENEQFLVFDNGKKCLICICSK